MIDRAIEFVRGVFSGDSGGHDFQHTMRVFRLASRIAKAEGADINEVQLAALLHDVDDIKLSPETNANLDRAVGFLKSCGAGEELICKVCIMIREVSFKGSDSVRPSTLEGCCVQDADRLDAIGAMGIARAFAYGGSRSRAMYDPETPPSLNMSEAEYRNSKSSTINHFYEKLLLLKDMLNTNEAIAIAGHRHEYMRAFLDEFMDEWNGIK